MHAKTAESAFDTASKGLLQQVGARFKRLRIHVPPSRQRSRSTQSAYQCVRSAITFVLVHRLRARDDPRAALEKRIVDLKDLAAREHRVLQRALARRMERARRVRDVVRGPAGGPGRREVDAGPDAARRRCARAGIPGPAGLYARYSLKLTATNPLVWSVLMMLLAAFVAYGRYALTSAA